MIRSTPLRRTAMPPRRTPLDPGCKPLTRRTPLAPVSGRRRSDNAHRAVVVSAMRLACAGRCARCGRSDMPVRGHERLARAHGGDILRPDCLLCDPCNGAIEDAPRVSCWNGWKLSPKWPHDPALTSSQARDLDGNVVEFTVDAEVA